MQVLGVEELGLWPHDMQVQIWILLQVWWSVYEMRMRIKSSGIAPASSWGSISIEKKETVDNVEEKEREVGEGGEDSSGLRASKEDA